MSLKQVIPFEKSFGREPKGSAPAPPPKIWPKPAPEKQLAYPKTPCVGPAKGMSLGALHRSRRRGLLPHEPLVSALLVVTTSVSRALRTLLRQSSGLRLSDPPR
jgi:hypothetical protein